MSDITKVAETSRRGLESVNPKLASQYNQIVALLAQRLGPDHAFLLAEPVPLGAASAAGADTAWYAKGAGSAQPLSALPEAEATAVRGKLERLVADIAALADQLQDEGETSRELGRLLRDALVLPDAQRVYVVDGRPVLVDWGNRTQAGTSVSAFGHVGFLAGMGGSGPTARRVAGGPPPPAPPTDDGGDPRAEPPGRPSPTPRPLRVNWLAHAALWIVFVTLVGSTAVRLLDACALGPGVWPAFVLNWLPGHCPDPSANPDVQAASERVRASEEQIRQQQIVIAIKSARCDALCNPDQPIPVTTPPKPLPPITAPQKTTPPDPGPRPTVTPPNVPPDKQATVVPEVRPQQPLVGPVVGPAPAPTAKDTDARVASLEHGIVEVTLAWDGPADLDLSVICPDKRPIDFHQRANCGGRLVQDMGVGGGALDAHSAEHIIWSAQPPAGTYTVNATLFMRYRETRSSVSYTVVLRLNGKDIREQTGQLSADGQVQTAFTFDSPLSN